MSSILSKMFVAHQLDLLHLSIINLLDMIKDGEIDLVLEQNKKTAVQKSLFIQKIIESLDSPELRDALQAELDAKNIDFFLEKHLRDILVALQKEAERIIPVHLTVAVEFKMRDLQDMVSLLSKSLGHQTVLDVHVDRSLIGGTVIQFGNYISDYSIKSRLEQFRSRWEEAVVEKA